MWSCILAPFQPAPRNPDPSPGKVAWDFHRRFSWCNCDGDKRISDLFPVSLRFSNLRREPWTESKQWLKSRLPKKPGYLFTTCENNCTMHMRLRVCRNPSCALYSYNGNPFKVQSFSNTPNRISADFSMPILVLWIRPLYCTFCFNAHRNVAEHYYAY
jgi:hypothetical protein